MRKTHLLFASASVVLLSACGSQSKSAIDADLRKDLELASSDDGISLGNGAVTSGQQFVSSIERTSPPARKVAASARVKRNKPAPKAPPKVVQAEAPAEVTEPEIQEVATAPIEVALDAPVSPRPQPMVVSYPGAGSSVIRGGVVGDIDHCDPRRTGRRNRGTILATSRLPFPVGVSRIGRVSIGRSVGRSPIGRTGGDITRRFPH